MARVVSALIRLAQICVILGGAAGAVWGQASFTARLQGTVYDSSGAVVPHAKVEITSVKTGITLHSTADELGRYIFDALRPAEYEVKVEAQGFRPQVQKNLVLEVGQNTDLDFTLEVGLTTSAVEVTAAPMLLNSVGADLGQAVTNRYVTEVPLFNRSVTNLVFLAPGVTLTGGRPGAAGAISPEQTGTNFVSNGQRNSTAEVRLDGGLTSAPEEGEGATTAVSYRPSIEIIQEFKMQNNGFSAEYGNNGGTVINMVSKSGTNEFHGTAYWFFRRPQLDANDFFANKSGQPKLDFQRDQYGFSLGGPVIRQKTFFFVDVDRIRNDYQQTTTLTVPTALERQGDFSKTFNADGSLQAIFDPNSVSYPGARRAPFSGNRIPESQLDAVGAKLASYYPDPTSAGDPVTGINNFTRTALASNPATQFDIKIDQNFSEKFRLMGRFSHVLSDWTPAVFYNTAADNARENNTHSSNAVLEETWMPSATFVWTTRVGVDRNHSATQSGRFDPTQLGFPELLKEPNGISIFPRVTPNGYGMLGIGGWVDTTSAHTQWQLSSVITKVAGGHNLRFGGEERIPLTNYWQPGHPDGWFQFSAVPTRQRVFRANPSQGNSIASMLLGWGNPYSWGTLDLLPASASRSRENAFFIQDDWHIAPRLTLNLGLRYEWSTPFADRYNRVQLADFAISTGITVPGIGPIRGAQQFATPDHRNADPDRNNFAPRIGFAYRPGGKTVVRGGAGIYYGMSPVTNHSSVGPAFRTSAVWQTSLDGGVTRYATLADPYPNGLPSPQGKKYGLLNMWGYAATGVTSMTVRNPEIYQWNLSVQRELPGMSVVEVAYSGSRSTHLPFNGTENQDFVSYADRVQYGDAGLNESVDNPFYPLFVGPNAVFNEPASIYSNETILRINLLRPYPQFDGTFSGNFGLIANARYNALMVRYEKRYSHGLNLIAGYTFSKLTDDSSSGSNNWLGNRVPIQDPTNLRLEHGLGGSDAPHRLVAGGSYELPIGRGKLVGTNWSRVPNALFGGWQVNSYLTLQSGMPLSLGLAAGVLADGAQRPNIVGNIAGSDIQTVVDGRGIRFNPNAFEAPPEQVPGTAPRFEGWVRGDVIHSLDLSLFKVAQIRENWKLQVRAEFFNFTNTPRFDDPNTSFGDRAFGTINAQLNSPRQSQFGLRLVF